MMKLKIIKFVLICCLVFQPSKVLSDALDLEENTSQWWNSTQAFDEKSRQDLVIQLAIICDQDFGNLFEGNENKMLEYWKSVLYGVHVRYQALYSFNFSFQVTSFRVLKEPVAFMESNRNLEGKLNLHGVLFDTFKWLGPQANNMPSFDIAILATGAEAVDALVAETPGSICMGNHIPGEWMANIVASVRTSDVAQLISNAIRRVLGFYFDDEKTALCGENIDRWKLSFAKSWEGLLKFFNFLKCVDKIFSEHFKKIPLKCLLSEESSTTVLYDTTSRIPGILSVQEQCRVRTNALDVGIQEEENSCDPVFCQLQPNSSEASQTLVPLNGSPCKFRGNEGLCFVGVCWPLEIQLVNVKTRKCMRSVDQLRKIKKLGTCVYGQLPQTDSIILTVKKNNATVLQSSWIECLQVDKDGLFKAGSCWQPTNRGWEIVKLNTSTNSNFMLRHLETNSCISALKDSSGLIGSSECHKSDSGMHWNFVLGNGTVLTHETYAKYVQKWGVSEENNTDENGPRTTASYGQDQKNGTKTWVLGPVQNVTKQTKISEPDQTNTMKIEAFKQDQNNGKKAKVFGHNEKNVIIGMKKQDQMEIGKIEVTKTDEGSNESSNFWTNVLIFLIVTPLVILPIFAAFAHIALEVCRFFI